MSDRQRERERAHALRQRAVTAGREACCCGAGRGAAAFTAACAARWRQSALAGGRWKAARPSPAPAAARGAPGQAAAPADRRGKAQHGVCTAWRVLRARRRVLVIAHQHCMSVCAVAACPRSHTCNTTSYTWLLSVGRLMGSSGASSGSCCACATHRMMQQQQQAAGTGGVSWCQATHRHATAACQHAVRREYGWVMRQQRNSVHQGWPRARTCANTSTQRSQIAAASRSSRGIMAAAAAHLPADVRDSR